MDMNKINMMIEIKDHPFEDDKHVYVILCINFAGNHISHCKLYSLYSDVQKTSYGPPGYKLAVVEDKDLLFFKMVMTDFKEYNETVDCLFIEDEQIMLSMAGYNYYVKAD